MKDKKHTIAADSMSAFENKQKSRRGILRIWHASHYSIQGLRAGWNKRPLDLSQYFPLCWSHWPSGWGRDGSKSLFSQEVSLF